MSSLNKEPSKETVFFIVELELIKIFVIELEISHLSKFIGVMFA